MMKRRKPSLMNKIATSFVAAVVLGIVIFGYLMLRLVAEAYEAGSEVQEWKAVLPACLPMCLAVIYWVWLLAAYSPGDVNLIRCWLRNGWPSRLDANGRLPVIVDRLVEWVVERQSRIDAAKSVVVRHDAWKWVGKPIGVGLLAAVAAAPLLFVAPLVGGDYGMRITYRGAGGAGLAIWVVATLAYIAALWFGVLDGNDRTRAMRMESGSKRQRVSDLFQEGVVPMAKSAESRSASESPTRSSARTGWVDAESSMKDFEHPQLAPPPDGFEWKFFRNAVFIQPKSWHVVVQEMPPVADGIGMDVYATSPGQFSSSSPFETGFTVQVMSGMKSGRWQSARHAYAVYTKPFFDRVRKEDFLLLDEKARGQTMQFIIRYRDVAAGLPSVIVHKFFVVNDAFEHVHVFTFESPEVSWQEQWARYGEMILGNIGIAHPQYDIASS